MNRSNIRTADEVQLNKNNTFKKIKLHLNLTNVVSYECNPKNIHNNYYLDIFKYKSFNACSFIKNYCDSLEKMINRSSNTFIYNKSDLCKVIFKTFTFNKNTNISVNLTDYLERIINIGHFNYYTIIYGLYLNNRSLKYLNEINYNPNKDNLILILCASIIISIKINEDQICAYKLYSQIFDISVNKLFLIENNFLELLNFKINVNEFKIIKFINNFIKKIKNY